MPDAVAAPKPTNLQRTAGYLRAHAGRALCAKCLSAFVGVRYSAAQNVILRLEGDDVFSVRHDECSHCRHRRLVVSARPRRRTTASAS